MVTMETRVVDSKRVRSRCTARPSYAKERARVVCTPVLGRLLQADCRECVARQGYYN